MSTTAKQDGEKLKDLVTLEHNDKHCAVLKVKPNKEMDLICLGCFNGDETMFRLTKGRDHTCTVWTKDGKSFSWEWGDSGYTLVSDQTREKGLMISDCLRYGFSIDMNGDDSYKTR